MKKQKYRIILDFDLILKNDEVLDKYSLKAFKNQIYNMAFVWDGYFYAYCDKKDGTAYNTDIIPSNVKIKLKNRNEKTKIQKI